MTYEDQMGFFGLIWINTAVASGKLRHPSAGAHWTAIPNSVCGSMPSRHVQIYTDKPITDEPIVFPYYNRSSLSGIGLQ